MKLGTRRDGLREGKLAEAKAAGKMNIRYEERCVTAAIQGNTSVEEGKEKAKRTPSVRIS